VNAALDALAAELRACLPGAVATNVPFEQLSTYRLGGPVAIVVRVTSAAQLEALASITAVERPPVLVIGRGSNLLVADTGFAGVGVLLEGDFEVVDLEGADLMGREGAELVGAAAADLLGGEGTEPFGGGGAERAVAESADRIGGDGAGRSVAAGGAVALPVLARRAAGAGLTGLEFFVGIPGTVGGALHMNAGGHGRETRDVAVGAWAQDLYDAAPPRWLTTDELSFDYRHSVLSDSDVVTAAQFRVRVDEVAACEERIAEIVRWRREHQPGGANAGSVFRNPPGDSAGRLIEAAGCKGLRVGGVVVSDKHANFFQAEPGARAADVHALITRVRRRVAEAFDVDLVPELRMIGFAELDGGDEEANG
jgi:UDP-N-acetylmuramate dehydrogenase